MNELKSGATDISVAQAACVEALAMVPRDQTLSEEEREASVVQIRQIVIGLIAQGNDSPSIIANIAAGKLRQMQQIERSKRSLHDSRADQDV